MICHFNHQPCKYIECPMWSERLQACKHALAIDKILGNGDRPLPELTSTEWRILSLLAQGYSNKEIGMAMSNSNQTIKNHVSLILQKLGAKNRTEATIIGLQHGIVSLQGSNN